MTTTPIPIKKHQLLDYVSKIDFNDFVEEVRNFRDETESRFNTIDSRFDAVNQRLEGIDIRLSGMDKRFSSIDRRLDTLGENFRIQTGAILDQFKEYMQINREHMQGVEERLMKEIRESR